MIIFLYGKDSYRRGKNLKKIISSYKKKNKSMDLKFFDFDEFSDDWKIARDFLEQPSIFADKKCIVIKSATTVNKKEWKDTVKKYIKTEDVFIVLSEEKKPNKFFDFLLKDPVFFKEFSILNDKELKSFFIKEIKIRNMSFSDDAFNFFIEYISKRGGGIWEGINELNKIELAKLEQPISLQNVGYITDWFLKSNVFSTTRYFIGNTKREKKLFLLEKLFIQKENPAYIFNSLACNVYGDDAIKLSEYDVSIKSGKLEYEEALLSFVLN